MITLRILKKDFLRTKGILAALFAFIFIASFLLASGTNLVTALTASLDSLFAKAEVPHFVQMHSGKFDRYAVAAWAEGNRSVAGWNAVEMITVDGASLFLGGGGKSEENSVMDISFVTQNTAFDFLLDLENDISGISPGEIGVPVFYLKRGSLKAGDRVTVKNGDFTMELTISAFIRDAQMNPSLVHSKRFLVNKTDYARLADHFPDTEYLLEFMLTDPLLVDDFSAAYQDSGMPKAGPTLDYRLFRIISSLTDGIVAAAVIALSLLLMLVSVLCLRFVILAAIEEDYKEIGVMKAIGMAMRDIKRVYALKYIAMGALASLAGYFASIFFTPVLSANILLYFGSAPKNGMQFAVPFFAAFIPFLIVVFACALLLRRFKRIGAVDALRSASTGDGAGNRHLPRLRACRYLDVNVFLGMRDVLQRFRLFSLLCIIFAFCSCIIIIPVHFLATLQSPSFISYMGISRCDMRIDLRQTENIASRFSSVVESIARDGDVARYSPLVTSRFTVLEDNGERGSINVETGDFSIFALDYTAGRAPASGGEIALSTLNAKDRGKKVGDTLTLVVGGETKVLAVCGLYQDVTNGGRTVKAVFPYNPDSVLWYNVSVDLKDGRVIDEKMLEYSKAFYPARITDLESYARETMGNTIDQLEKVTLVSIFVGLAVAVLITSLFLKMLVQKDTSRIAIMKSIGFSLSDIRLQYLSSALLLLCIGISAGTVFSNTGGQSLMGFMWSFMGASQIAFIVNPFLAYLVLPLLLLASVSITAVLRIGSIKDTSIAGTIQE